MKVQEILNKLIEIRRNSELDISDNCLFENAVKIYLSNKIQGFKEKNISNYKSAIVDTQKPETKHIMATDKQVNYLIRLGFSGNIDSLTKEEARVIISEMKGGKHGKN